MTFSVSTTLEAQVSQSSLRSARSDIESELGDIQVGVDGSNVSSQLGGALPDGGVAAAGGAALGDKLDEQTDWLEDIHDVVEQSAVSAGGGGGGGFLSNILPSGGGGGQGSGFLSGLLTGSLALKAKDVLSVNGKLATKAKNVLSMTGLLSLSAGQYIGVAGAVTLTAGAVLAVQGRYTTQAQETLAVGGILSVGAASVLAMTGMLSLPAAAVIAVTGVVTLGVAEIVEILPDGPGPAKTDGVRDSTHPDTNLPAGDGTQIYSGTVTGPSGVTDMLERMQTWDPVESDYQPISNETAAQARAQQSRDRDTGGDRSQSPGNRAASRGPAIVEVNENLDVRVEVNETLRQALRDEGLDPDKIEEIVREYERNFGAGRP